MIILRQERHPLGNLNQVTMILKADPPEPLAKTGAARVWLP